MSKKHRSVEQIVGKLRDELLNCGIYMHVGGSENAD